MLVGELMGSKRLLIVVASGLFLAVIIVWSLTLTGDSQSIPDVSSADQPNPPTIRNTKPPSTEATAKLPVAVDNEAAAPPLDENSGEVKASLPLFRSVDANYFRGAEPGREGVDLLVRLGVKTLVDLRSKYDRSPGVAAEADRAGLGYYWLPLSVWDPPTDAQTSEFVGVVTDKSRGPVFVFCTDGVNRTGEMTAIYRMKQAGWSAEQAVKEMDDAGFSPYYYSLRNYVWAFARTHNLNIREPHQK